MTKDRPRNRSGNGRKSGGFQGRGGGKPWSRGPRDRGGPSGAGESAGSGDDKPWAREQPAGRTEGDGPRRFHGKPSGERFNSARSEFGSKPTGKFQHKPRRFEGKRDGRSEGDAGDRPRDKFRGKPERKLAERPERSEGKPPENFRNRPDRTEDRSDRPFRPKPHHAPRRDERRPPHGGQWERRDAAFEENGEVWIWGVHAAGAALANPKRRISKAYVSRNAAHRAGLDADALPAFAELLEPKEIDDRLPPGAVHQGLAVRCASLDGLDISEAVAMPERPLVILDQLTDPQNVGAVFRSAAAFGIAGVVMQTRNSPLLGGALAKAAAGAIERVEEIRAVNLSRAIDALRDAGWRVIGLDGSAEQTLGEAFAGDEPLAIVLGAEGAGIRPGVAKACSGLARIPIGDAMESLNVSNAAAIAFYEAMRRGGAPPPPAKPPQRTASNEDAETEETE